MRPPVRPRRGPGTSAGPGSGRTGRSRSPRTWTRPSCRRPGRPWSRAQLGPSGSGPSGSCGTRVAAEAPVPRKTSCAPPLVVPVGQAVEGARRRPRAGRRRAAGSRAALLTLRRARAGLEVDHPHDGPRAVVGPLDPVDADPRSVARSVSTENAPSTSSGSPAVAQVDGEPVHHRVRLAPRRQRRPARCRARARPSGGRAPPTAPPRVPCGCSCAIACSSVPRFCPPLADAVPPAASSAHRSAHRCAVSTLDGETGTARRRPTAGASLDGAARPYHCAGSAPGDAGRGEPGERARRRRVGLDAVDRGLLEVRAQLGDEPAQVQRRRARSSARGSSLVVGRVDQLEERRRLVVDVVDGGHQQRAAGAGARDDERPQLVGEHRAARGGRGLAVAGRAGPARPATTSTSACAPSSESRSRRSGQVPSCTPATTTTSHSRPAAPAGVSTCTERAARARGERVGRQVLRLEPVDERAPAPSAACGPRTSRPRGTARAPRRGRGRPAPPPHRRRARTGATARPGRRRAHSAHRTVCASAPGTAAAAPTRVEDAGEPRHRRAPAGARRRPRRTQSASTSSTSLARPPPWRAPAARSARRTRRRPTVSRPPSGEHASRAAVRGVERHGADAHAHGVQQRRGPPAPRAAARRCPARSPGTDAPASARRSAVTWAPDRRDDRHLRPRHARARRGRCAARARRTPPPARCSAAWRRATSPARPAAPAVARRCWTAPTAPTRSAIRPTTAPQRGVVPPCGRAARWCARRARRGPARARPPGRPATASRRGTSARPRPGPPAAARARRRRRAPAAAGRWPRCSPGSRPRRPARQRGRTAPGTSSSQVSRACAASSTTTAGSSRAPRSGVPARSCDHVEVLLVQPRRAGPGGPAVRVARGPRGRPGSGRARPRASAGRAARRGRGAGRARRAGPRAATRAAPPRRRRARRAGRRGAGPARRPETSVGTGSPSRAARARSTENAAAAAVCTSGRPDVRAQPRREPVPQVRRRAPARREDQHVLRGQPAARPRRRPPRARPSSCRCPARRGRAARDRSRRPPRPARGRARRGLRHRGPGRPRRPGARGAGRAREPVTRRSHHEPPTPGRTTRAAGTAENSYGNGQAFGVQGAAL